MDFNITPPTDEGWLNVAVALATRMSNPFTPRKAVLSEFLVMAIKTALPLFTKPICYNNQLSARIAILSAMTPSILVVGATGNTGRNVVRSLPNLVKTTIGEHRIIALTRDAKSAISQEFAKIPQVEVIEKHWDTIDAEWLREHCVVRAFVASHNFAHQYTDESSLYVAMLQAGVKYVVRISTTNDAVSAANTVYYGRTHWAIEHTLDQPEYDSMLWTSLQANPFAPTVLVSILQWFQDYKTTGKQGPLKLNIGEADKVAVIDPDDVGHIAATLLATVDPKVHNKARYIIRGPEDNTGKDLVDLVEKYAGVKVEEVRFRDKSFTDNYTQWGYAERHIPSLTTALYPIWASKLSIANSPTAKEILDIAPPTTRLEDSLRAMLNV